MNRYVAIRFYTLAELLEAHNPDLTRAAIIGGTKKLSDVITGTPWVASTFGTEVQTCFKWLYTRVTGMYLFEGTDEAAFTAMLDKLMPIIITGEAKYKPIISAYTAALAKPGALMAKIVQSTTTKDWYNDTPQSPNADGEDLDHLTNFTKNTNENSNDLASPMARIIEIQQSIRNVYWDWTDEIIKTLCWEDEE